jgi:hypothetical protein
MAIPGTNIIFKMDNAADALTDISTSLKNAKPTKSRDSVDVTTYGSADKVFQALLMGANLSVEGINSTAMDTHFDAAYRSAATKTVELYPEGIATGKPKYTGETWCIQHDISPPVEGVQMFSATLQVSGPWTRSLQA